jgi:DNA-binding response OmpR family regulator
MGMAMLLEISGYDVLKASNAREAVSRALSASLSCIILSISLPGGNSMEILRSLRGLTGATDMPVVLIAPPDLRLEESSGFVPGRDRRLVPSFRPMDLLNAVLKVSQRVSA